MIHIEAICNAYNIGMLPKPLNDAALVRYMSTKGYVPTEDISLENCVMLLSYDTEIESVPGADGESVKLWVKPLGVDQ